MVDDPEKKNRRVKAAFDPAIQAHIGQQLKSMYDEVARQPVPDELVRLLDALGTKTAPGGAEGTQPPAPAPGGRRNSSESA